MTSAPPAPMPASPHWKPASDWATEDDGGVRTCGLTGHVGACWGTGFGPAGIGLCWSGAATSVPAVTWPETGPIGVPGPDGAGIASAAPGTASASAPVATVDLSARERDRTAM